MTDAASVARGSSSSSDATNVTKIWSLPKRTAAGRTPFLCPDCVVSSKLTCDLLQSFRPCQPHHPPWLPAHWDRRTMGKSKRRVVWCEPVGWTLGMVSLHWVLHTWTSCSILAQSARHTRRRVEDLLLRLQRVCWKCLYLRWLGDTFGLQTLHRLCCITNQLHWSRAQGESHLQQFLGKVEKLNK